VAKPLTKVHIIGAMPGRATREGAVGRSVLRKEGAAKVTGAARYIDDLPFPGLLHARTIRSTIAAGEILGVAFDFDRAGFTIVDHRDVPGHPEILVAGDICAMPQDGRQLPGVAQVAKQQGAHAARNVLRAVRGEPQQPFRYRDYGSAATIGRGSAVVDIGPVRASGPLAWLFWLFLHIFWLIGFRNRVAVLGEWAWAYVTFQRRVRLITGERLWPSP